MPWKETCPMDQRLSFVADWLRDEWTMTELAKRYAISRKTAYKWVARYETDGAPGLVERSRAPTHPGRAISPTVGRTVLWKRYRRTRWSSSRRASARTFGASLSSRVALTDPTSAVGTPAPCQWSVAPSIWS